MAIALMPGSYDPIHLGHMEMVGAAARVFSHVIVAAVGNPDKGSGVFDLAEREALIAESVAHLPNVSAGRWTGLVVDYAREIGADAIVKGLRGVADFEYEVQMAQMNQFMTGMPTLFLPTAPQYAHVASRWIREISRLGGNVSGMVPPPVGRRLAELFPVKPSTDPTSSVDPA